MKANHDIHNHSMFSNCCRDKTATVAAMIKREEELGVEIYGLANHAWDEHVKGNSPWYAHQSTAHALEAKLAYAFYNGPVKLLFGVETDFFATTNTLGMSYETATKFDYIMVPHSHNHMRGWVMAEFPDIVMAKQKLAREIESKMLLNADAAAKMANAAPKELIEEYAKEFAIDRDAYIMNHMLESMGMLLENTEFNKIIKTVPVSIAHPFAPGASSMEDRPKVTERFVNEFEPQIFELFSKAAKMGVAMEINLSATYETGYTGFNYPADHPAVRLFKIAKRAGCKFTFGTDSHGPADLERIHTSDDFTRAAGITEADVADWDCLKK